MVSAVVIIEIPELPCSVNKAFSTFRGHRITTRDYKAWARLVEQYIPDNIPDLSRSCLSVEIDLIAPNWFTKVGSIRKVDVDNYAKTCLDAIFYHLPIDDSHIFTLKISKVVSDSQNRRTVVRIYDLSAS